MTTEEGLAWWLTLDLAERTAWRDRATCGIYGCPACRPDQMSYERASVGETIEWSISRRK